MKVRRLAVLLALVGGMVTLVTPVGARPQDTACKAEYILTISPFGTQPVSHGTAHSGGESGTINCGSGSTGTIGFDGRYGTKEPATCTSGGEGWGVFSYTFGGKTVKDTLTFDFGKISGGVVSGTFKGERYSGTLTSTPIEGNCASEPVTKTRVQLDGVLAGG